MRVRKISTNVIQLVNIRIHMWTQVYPSWQLSAQYPPVPHNCISGSYLIFQNVSNASSSMKPLLSHLRQLDSKHILCLS